MTLHYRKPDVEYALERACTHADNVTLTSERNCLEDWLALHAENEKLRAALAQVEWHDIVCPWCGGVKPGAVDLIAMKKSYRGHAPSCPRQAALKGQL